MAHKEHSHWDRYHVRIRGRIMYGKEAPMKEEILQCICIDDGVIFHETVIKSES